MLLRSRSNILVRTLCRFIAPGPRGFLHDDADGGRPIVQGNEPIPTRFVCRSGESKYKIDSIEQRKHTDKSLKPRHIMPTCSRSIHPSTFPTHAFAIPLACNVPETRINLPVLEVFLRYDAIPAGRVDEVVE